MSALLAIAILGGVAVVAARFLSERRQTVTTLRHTPKTALSGARPNKKLKLVGRAAYRGEPLRSPISNRHCCLYEVTIDFVSSSGQSDEPAIHEFGGLPFYLECEDGRALINPSWMHAALVRDVHQRRVRIDLSNPAHVALLDRNGYARGSQLARADLVCTEAIVELGEALSVLGRGTWEPDPDPAAAGKNRSYREGPPMRFHMAGTRKRPLLISDEFETFT